MRTRPRCPTTRSCAAARPITAGELRALRARLGSRELNRAKAFSRVGMGRCQGRYCGHAAAEIVAAAAGVPIESVGRLRTQAPVKPLLMDARGSRHEGVTADGEPQFAATCWCSAAA